MLLLTEAINYRYILHRIMVFDNVLIVFLKRIKRHNAFNTSYNLRYVNDVLYVMWRIHNSSDRKHTLGLSATGN